MVHRMEIKLVSLTYQMGEFYPPSPHLYCLFELEGTEYIV